MYVQHAYKDKFTLNQLPDDLFPPVSQVLYGTDNKLRLIGRDLVKVGNKKTDDWTGLQEFINSLI